MNLEALPTRLLKHILSFIDDICDYFHLRVTSKRLHRASKVYSVFNPAQCYLFDALITFVPDVNGHLDLSHHQRYHLLCQFICIESPKLPESLVINNSKCIYSQLQLNYGSKTHSVITLDEFQELTKCMTSTQVRTICILVKSLIAKRVITSLDLSWCCFNTKSATSHIRFMKQQGLNLKLRYLNLNCNYITSFVCIHNIQDVLDDCELSMQFNNLHKNKFFLPIKGVTQVQAVGNHISNKIMLPTFLSNHGHIAQVITDD